MNAHAATLAFSRKPGRRPFVLGHRGARAHCPENSLLAFERALQDGADGVELDVRMSADGQLYIAHDDEIETCGGIVALHRLSSSQLDALDTSSGQPLLTLKEALAFQARTGAYLNVELKGDVPAPLWMARRASDEIKEHGGSGILLSSFDPRQVFALSRHLPQVPVALLFAADHKCSPRLLRYEKFGARAAHPQAALLDENLMQQLRARVLVVNTWTVNDATEVLRLAKLGVDGIITDDPKMALDALAAQ